MLLTCFRNLYTDTCFYLFFFPVAYTAFTNNKIMHISFHCINRDYICTYFSLWIVLRERTVNLICVIPKMAVTYSSFIFYTRLHKRLCLLAWMYIDSCSPISLKFIRSSGLKNTNKMNSIWLMQKWRQHIFVPWIFKFCNSRGNAYIAQVQLWISDGRKIILALPK